MSSFFQHSAESMINKHIDRYPLLKLDRVIDWQSIEHCLVEQKNQQQRDNRGRANYPLLSMFKAILLGQWHSLSDPELEHSLITRLDFYLFCGFGEMHIPDHSTLCRYRNWLAKSKILPKLLNLINCQLEAKGLKIEKAETAIVDATIIQSAGSVQKKAIETGEDGEIRQTPASKDRDARWTKKKGKYTLGYKKHTLTDQDGYIEQLHVSPANEHESQHLEPLLENLSAGTTVYADKGYSSQANRERLRRRGLRDGIMEKASRNQALSQAQKARNKLLSKTRYVIERTFGRLHRKFSGKRASYFGLIKVEAQYHLKAICLNLLKAGNRIHMDYCA